jgi:hypothetical protein
MTFGGVAGAQSTNDESAAARLWQSLSGVEDKPRYVREFALFDPSGN